ncbi:MAG: anti-sigma factor [Acidobacteriaceae bacterium]|nr:anti-sigma factor [Acidobacteriaceae bacterium]
MTHEEMSELYELYAFGVLDEDEKTEIEEHLARKCPECEAGVRQALAMSSMLAMMPDQVAAPKRLRTRVLASVGGQPKRDAWWIWALAAVSACLLIGVVLLGVDRTRANQEIALLQGELRQSGTELTRLNAMLEMLNQPETRQVVFGQGTPQPPQGRIFVNARRGVLLIASHLPVPPRGRTYEMWLVPKSGAPIPAGLFLSNTQGDALYLRTEAVDVSNTKAVAVTLEPEAGSAVPTMPLVFAAALE